MKKECPICKNLFNIKKSHYQRRKYCSRLCMSIGYRQRLNGINNPNYSNKLNIFICKYCKKEFNSYHKNRKYCSKKCYGFDQRIFTKEEISIKNCKMCKKKYIKTNKLYGEYCSKECKYNDRIRYCKKCGKKIKRTKYCKKCFRDISQDKRKIRVKCSVCSCEVIRHRSAYIGKKIFCNNCKYIRKGKFNSNWKGGIQDINKAIRNSEKYKKWRSDIFQRDKYLCQICWKKGYKLQVHHIKSFSRYPKERFNLNNGVTLCKKCHLDLHIKNGGLKNPDILNII